MLFTPKIGPVCVQFGKKADQQWVCKLNLQGAGTSRTGSRRLE